LFESRKKSKLLLVNRTWLLSLALLFASILSAQFSSAQATEPANASTPLVSTDAVTGLKYPPLARAAQITGDVKLRIRIRPDGSVVSLELLSGHPMLAPAAIASAQQSKFRCLSECSNDVTTFVFTYTFALKGNSCAGITVNVRSAKCLYLWKCSHYWHAVPSPPPTITTEPNQFILLETAPCVETETSTTAFNMSDRLE
jgi:TonB family protein